MTEIKCISKVLKNVTPKNWPPEVSAGGPGSRMHSVVYNGTNPQRGTEVSKARPP